MSAKMYFGDGLDVTITDDEYIRFRNAVGKSSNMTLQPFRNMAGGVIVNLNHVQAIVPDAVPQSPEAWVEPTYNTEVQVEFQDKGEPVSEQTITMDDLNAIMTTKKLKPADLSAALEYSPATVRMALKGDRISAEFSDKVRATYPEFFTTPESNLTPQFHPADEG